MGKKKHYYMTWGPALDVLFFSSNSECPTDKMTKTRFGFTFLYYSTGYEFKSGLGFNFNMRIGQSSSDSNDTYNGYTIEYEGYLYGSFGGALTYRF